MGVALAPVNGHGAGARLLEAGARELYLGFYDPAWTERFAGAALNRMSGFGAEANSLSFGELLDEARALRAHDPAPRGLFCVFNAMAYTAAQHDYAARAYFAPLAAAGFTGVILSDASLAYEAHAAGLEAVLSTMGAVCNAELARYHRDAGLDRVILPRDLSLDEIAEVVAAVPDLSYEVFLMRNGCPFADAHCMGFHRAGQPSLCRSLRASCVERQVSGYVPQAARLEGPARDAHALWADRFHLNTCGLCALWRFEQLGVDAYKVVGRGDDVDSLADDVELVARNIEVARSCGTEAAFLAAMERPEGLRVLCENDGLSCYYPEVRFG
jgi:putative protease